MSGTHEERPYWNMEMEPILNTPEMSKIQFARLRKMLVRLKDKAPYYARMMEKNRLDPERLTGFDEFKEKIAVFTKQSMRDLVEEYGGDYLKALEQRMAVSLEELDWIATTTGTTGVPTPYPLTNRDLMNFWSEFTARGCWRSGVRSSDRILYCFALSMVIAGVPSAIAFQRVGATMLPVGAEAKSERILSIQNLFKGTVFVGTPSLAEYMIEQAPRLIGKEVGQLGLKILLCGAEPGAGIPEVRAKLEDAYKAKVFDIGAGVGFSCDYEEYQGMHWLLDDLCYFELVDPETKRPIPLENGAQGEYVYTTLDNDALVSVRESPGDIMQVFTEPCPCGRSGFRYKVVGRTDDMLKVKGVMVYPSHIKGVINDFVPRVTGELRIILDEPPPRVVPPLKVRVEHAEGLTGDALNSLAQEISDAMSKRLKINPQIIWAEPGSLERSLYKGQVFEKTYKREGGKKHA
ncbi:MAG: Phenylacetate-coenzyme A ligase [Syntrophorhabdus sp. PtaU1.Bin058]|nr:MAG: Phenylacetate-coenzyme A ligase [Syntrophorhabdus sp. PtaU1.Bin058]